MKKTLLTLAFFIGLALAANAQQTPVPGTIPVEKPKSAIEQSKVNSAVTPAADTAKASAANQKKTVKRSCCKKHDKPCVEPTPGQPKPAATRKD